MSSNTNHSISLSNYEEWFILYMDNELDADQQQMVNDFLRLHPHLQEELDFLLSTKLPGEETVFSGKKHLHADAMRLGVIDESLLLYLDNELSTTERKRVEEKISLNKDTRLQYDLLQQTKLDPSETIYHPNKEELYRRSEKVVPLFPVWMRIAVAVILVLFGGYFFLFDKVATPPAGDGYVARKDKPVQSTATTPAVSTKDPLTDNRPSTIVAKAARSKQTEYPIRKEEGTKPVALPQNNPSQENLAIAQQTEAVAIQRPDVVSIDITKLTTEDVTALNKSIAKLAVTSASPVSYNLSDNPEESIVTDGDVKPARTPAKGFLRKVSRFIERRTGIGTVNADNELLVGALALKLN